MLKLWERPNSYAGAEWPDYYVVVGQHRDSDSLTRSNFAVAMARLKAIEETLTIDGKSPKCCSCIGEHCDNCGGDGTMPCLVNPYESHWAVGHVEWIGVHKDSPQALIDEAKAIAEAIEAYPCLSEDHWSELEYSEAMEFWNSLSLSSKVNYCRDAEVSIFAARRSYDLPDRLYESLTSN